LPEKPAAAFADSDTCERGLPDQPGPGKGWPEEIRIGLLRALADFCRAFFAARNRKGRILAIIKKNRHNPDKLLSGLL